MGKRSREEQKKAGENASAALEWVEKAAEELGVGLSSMLVYEDERGVQRVNPLYLAAISEQLQFDGDIPELRTGDMPKEAMPAVPVDLESLNLVSIGFGLEKASRQTREQINAHTRALISEDDGVLVKLGADADLPAYRRGTSPAFVEMKVTGSEIALLSESQKQMYAWKALTSTPGRKSVALVLHRMIQQEFPEMVPVGESERDPVGETHWETSFGNKEEIEPRFPVIGLVWGSFRRFIDKQVKTNLGFKVKPINKVSDRIAGWSLYLYD